MKVHTSFESLAAVKNAVVTTGTFDGVHVGHQAIIRQLKKLADRVKGETVLVTFHPHPRRVLYPEGQGKDLLLICSQEEKKELLNDTGLDHLVIIPFTKEFARITSEEFVRDLLIQKLHARVIVVGFNHQFGYNREGDFSFLHKMGRCLDFEVEEIPEQDIHNETVSSTKIRKALIEGNIQRANAYLDHYYLVQAELKEQRDDSLGIARPVYSLSLDEDVKLIPPDGVYAVNVEQSGEIRKGIVVVRDWGLENNLRSSKTMLDLCLLNSSGLETSSQVKLYFHKHIHQGVPKDKVKCREILERDLKTLEELIF